eukprot:CAMPEP_0115012276 /NCGR_PEP_ID=MMETSP0216-20121206/24623_1 /TAXON_ID=223996 /ORGANISM="Protocruzia adherens, Strain Boccale" /LENGTH=269 /DNA_ID=CAMNT_0002381267 /DNA_START=793 /DNA_END=1598 /DNA_ORIENTATION=-
MSSESPHFFCIPPAQTGFGCVKVPLDRAVINIWYYEFVQLILSILILAQFVSLAFILILFAGIVANPLYFKIAESNMPVHKAIFSLYATFVIQYSSFSASYIFAYINSSNSFILTLFVVLFIINVYFLYIRFSYLVRVKAGEVPLPRIVSHIQDGAHSVHVSQVELRGTEAVWQNQLRAQHHIMVQSITHRTEQQAIELISANENYVVTEDDVKESETCPFCFEGLKVNETVKRLKCYHLIHADCSIKWFRQHNSCPFCRFNIVDNEHA